MMRRLDAAFGCAENWCAVILFWLLGIDVFAQFFTRYVLNSPIGWTEEVARFLLVVVCYAGSLVAVRKGTHIRLELLEKLLPEKCERIFRQQVIGVVSLVLFVYLSYLSFEFSMSSRRRMTSMQLPLQVIYWPIFGLFIAMSVRCVIKIVCGEEEKE